MKTNHLLKSLFLLILVSVLFSYCKKDDDNNPPAPGTNLTLLAEEQIGPGGGILSSEEITISIPEGSFSKTEEISLFSKELLTGHPLSENALSGLFQLKGIPADFSKPIAVKIKGNPGNDTCYLVNGVATWYSEDTITYIYELAKTTTDGEYITGDILPYAASGKSGALVHDATDDLILEIILSSGYRKYVTTDKLITIDYPSYVPVSSVRILARYFNEAHLSAVSQGFQTIDEYSIWVGKKWLEVGENGEMGKPEVWFLPLNKNHYFPGYMYFFCSGKRAYFYYYTSALDGQKELLKLEQSAFRAVYFSAGFSSANHHYYPNNVYFISDLASWAQESVTFNQGFKQPLYFDDYIGYSLNALTEREPYYLQSGYSPQLKYVYDHFQPIGGGNLMVNLYNERMDNRTSRALFKANRDVSGKEMYEWYPDFIKRYLTRDIYLFDLSALSKFMSDVFTIKEIPFSGKNGNRLFLPMETRLYRFNIGGADLSEDDCFTASTEQLLKYSGDDDKSDVKFMAYAYENYGTTTTLIGTGEGHITITNLKQYKKNESILLAVCYAPSVDQSNQIELSFKIERGDDNTFIDPRDGQVYRIVTIGSQTWFAENLNYETGSGSWCYDDDPANCDVYGRLYTWDSAMTACPDGWHLPADEEWKQLEMYLGMSQSQADGTSWRGNDEGKKLKSVSGWIYSGNGTDEVGFRALPGGYYYGAFYDLNYGGGWWSATTDGFTDAWYRYLYHDKDKISRMSSVKAGGFSVRCLRD